MKSKMLCIFLQFLAFLVFSACTEEGRKEESSAPKTQSEVSNSEDSLEKNKSEFLEYEASLETYTMSPFNYKDYELAYSYTESNEIDAKSWKIYSKKKNGHVIFEDLKIIDDNNLEVDTIQDFAETIPDTLSELFNRFHYKWYHGLNDEYAPCYCELFYKEFDGIKIPYKFICYNNTDLTDFGKTKWYFKYEILDLKIEK